MSKAIKATLLSALVFPGVGHFFLKKHIAGALLAGAAFAALYLVISRMVERVLQIVDKIEHGEVSLDVTAIAELISRQPTGTDALLLRIAWIVLIVCWLIGIVDSYRVGRSQGNGGVAEG
jgi:hypothetical protein